MATQNQAIMHRSYDDIEPFCRWQREEEQDVLELHLKGFTKEQLKIQRNDHGIVSITGERPLDDTTWARFGKEIKVPKDCKVNEIWAKLGADNILRVMLPKKSPLPVAGTPKSSEIWSRSLPSSYLVRPECPGGTRLNLCMRVAAVLAAILALVTYAHKYYQIWSQS